MSKFLLTLNARSIADQIAALLNGGGQLWAHVYSSTVLNSTVTYLIELESDTVIGVMGLDQQSPSVTEMKHLCVHPDYRKRGIGKKLLEKGLAAAQTEFVYGAVRSDNYTNIRNNLRIGMVPIGKKRGRGCHIIIFARRTNNRGAIFRS